jgi:cytochrome c biogenesis protein CcmG, thiol:disulfide interchange protein DsbE
MSQVTTAPPQASPPKGWQQRLRESRLGTVLVLAVTAVIVMVGAYLVNGPAAATGVNAVNVGPSDGPAPKIGSPAHDFTATTVDGKRVSLSSFKGQPVWLTFGATWCSPCQAEAPDIQAAYQKYKAQGLVILSVSISEDASTVLDYGKRIGLTFPQIADPASNIAGAYRVNGIPAHFFIDKSGILRSIKSGGMSPEHMDTAIGAIIR